MSRVQTLKQRVEDDALGRNGVRGIYLLDVRELCELYEAEIKRKDAALRDALPILQDFASDAEEYIPLVAAIDSVRRALTEIGK